MVGEFQKATEVSEIPEGTMKIVKLMGHEISIANVEGQFYAFPNNCTHAGGPLGRGRLKGFVVQCPLHGSKFDIRTGAVVTSPAQTPLRTFVVKVEKGTVWVKSSH
jgi:3-phenylpropionate/trans-cinnamate dioxygenase ferredoxin subunit